MKYGLSDVIMYATFDYQRMCVRLHVDCCKFNRHYQHAEYGKLMSMTDGNGYNLTQDDMLRYISSMINEIEFCHSVLILMMVAGYRIRHTETHMV